MGIEANFNSDQIRERIERYMRAVEKATLEGLQYLGESLASYAKQNITFTPRSGNLQSSIGYVIVKSGEPITMAGFGGSPEGVQEGIKFAEQVARETPNGFALIIVAGMNYAAYVEAKGYNVILPAELKAKAEFKPTLERFIAAAESKSRSIFDELNT